MDADDPEDGELFELPSGDDPVRRRPLLDPNRSRGDNSVFTVSGNTTASGVLFRLEPIADPPHITVTGVYIASSDELKLGLLFVNYFSPGTASTLDTLNALVRLRQVFFLRPRCNQRRPRRRTNMYEANRLSRNHTMDYH